MVHIYQVYKKSLHAFCTPLSLLAAFYFAALFSLWPDSTIYFHFYVYTWYCGKNMNFGS